MNIRHAAFPADTAAIVAIWREYLAATIANLDYQENEVEFANLPGKYARPSGCIMLAEHDGHLVGCVAFRQVSDEICEMKRLYVRPSARGLGLGAQLARRAIEVASQANYSEMRLDVLAEFTKARAIYEALGFTPADPIAFNPIPGTSFLGLVLR